MHNKNDFILTYGCPFLSNHSTNIDILRILYTSTRRLFELCFMGRLKCYTSCRKLYHMPNVIIFFFS